MRIRTSLLTAAIGSAFLAGSALVPGALAQHGSSMLDPTTPWAVKKVDDRSGQKDPYCAVARRFVPQTVMTVAKNGRDETSFALDFQSPRLDTGNVYYVLLNPGAGQKRAYEVRPVSQRAFVIRMGDDERFYDALRKTGYLRVEVGNQGYNFNLADIDAGWNKLDSCVDDIRIVPRRDGFVPRSAQGQPSYPSSHYRFRKESALDSARSSAHSSAEDSDLQAKLRDMERENKRLKLAGASERDTFAVADGLLERVNWLEEENNILSQQLAEARAMGVAGAQGSDYEHIASLEEENIELRAALREYEGANFEGQVRNLEKKVSMLERENIEIMRMAQAEKERLEQQKDVKISALEAMHRENKKVHEQSLARMQVQIDKLNDTIHKKDSKLLAMAKDSVAYDNVLSSKLALEEQVKALKQSEAEVEKLRQQIVSLEKENAGLVKRIAMLEQQVESANVAANSVSEAEPASQKPEGLDGGHINLTLSEGGAHVMDSLHESARQHQSAKLAAAPLPQKKIDVVEVVKPSVKPPVPSQNVLASVIERLPTEPSEPSAADLAQIEPSSGDADIGQTPSHSDRKGVSIIRQAGGDLQEWDIPALLEQSNIIKTSAVDMAGKRESPWQVAYRWHIGGVFGTAEQVKAPDQFQFGSFVQQYLKRLKNRCEGDFAIIPDRSIEKDGENISTYELACIGSKVNLSASLIFFQKGKLYNVVAHEVPSESLAKSMEMRDRLLRTIEAAG